MNEVLSATNADFIVNTAAMHHVEKCEADPMAAFAANAIGAKNLGEWAEKPTPPLPS